MWDGSAARDDRGRVVTPSPEQIQAAMPAMREWAGRLPGWTSRDAFWRTDEQIVDLVAFHYRGGVAQFIADQEERRG